MNKSKYIFLLITIFGQLSILAQDDEKEKLEINGFVRNFSGVLIEPPNDFAIFQNTLNLEFRKQNEKIGFYANPFIYQYPNGTDVFDVRELYIDFFSDKVDFRIGKQQIIWGQADGVFITDVVSPLDLTEFLLRDFSEIRKGVTSAKMKYYPKDNHTVELIWIPQFTSTTTPEAGSIWMPEMSFLAPPTFDYSKNEVASNLENSEFFGRYSLSTAAFDVELMGGYTWDDNQVNHIAKQFVMDTTGMHLTGLTITPQYHRMSLGGLSFNTDIKGFILRGEGAYYSGKYFNTEDPMNTESVVDKDYLNYVVGLDKSVGDWKFSGQFIQKRIQDYDEYIMTDEVENLATLLVNRTLFREKLRLELFAYYGIENEDALVRLRGFYMPSDGVSIELGTNYFVGETGTFGVYKDNSMIYTRVKYNF